jgi:P-type Cu+ transporter
METIQWKVEGMDCSNCALTIQKFLERKGMKNIQVDYANGDVRFDMNNQVVKEELAEGLKDLGYEVAPPHAKEKRAKPFLSTHLHRFLFCLPFTLLLMMHMAEQWIHIALLMNPWVQLILCVPVYVVGMSFFGRSAIKSIRNRLPNMNVLIALGATAAFVYSLIGTLFNLGESFLFYETAATIITLVFLGNYLEDASVRSTQKALKSLVKSQKVMANMIAFDENHQEVILPIENTRLKVGDLILIRSGEQVPIDCKILWGEAHVNEAIITGESVPVHKLPKDKMIGGSVLESGLVKAQVTAVGDDTILSNILNLVKRAQGERPPVQQLADKISAVFVPVVLVIALLTLGMNWFLIKEFTPALMRSIAVLVIACPCAMGLATPAAIAVGLGRAARSGILFRNSTSLESFKDIRQVVFDKTGTLTTGKFKIHDSGLTNGAISENEFRKISWSLEKYSDHPIARCISSEWKTKDEVKWKNLEEVKGKGMKAEDTEGNIYWAGSFEIAANLTKDRTHNVYIVKNNELLGWIDVSDEIRPEAKSVVQYFKSKKIKTILLSGDRYANSKTLADQLGIEEVIAEKSPEEKMQKIEELNRIAPTAMVGDGINDAPALAKASIGISLSEASQLAMQTAQVVLMNNGLKNLPTALGLGKHTYTTIKQNLFWAFFYNVVAIPVAALGFLTPSFGALVMGLSDVVLAINSMRLFVKKVV